MSDLEKRVQHQKQKINALIAQRERLEAQPKDESGPVNALKAQVEWEEEKGAEIGRLRDENGSLRAELASTRQQVTTLVTQVETLAKQMAQQSGELERMRLSVIGRRESTDEADGPSKMAPLQDRTNLLGEQMEELRKLMPAMETRISTLEHSVIPNTTPNTGDTRSLESLMQRLKEIQALPEKMAVRVGEMIDQLRSKSRSQEGRITALEKVADTAVTDVKGQLVSIRSDVALSFRAIKRELQEQIQTGLQQERGIFVEDTDKRFEQVEHMISTLDGQFKNLTTQQLLSQIIGHLDMLCRSPRALAADIDLLANKVQALEQRMGDVSKNVHGWDTNAVTQIQRLRAMVDKIGQNSVEEILDQTHPAHLQRLGSQVSARNSEVSA